MSLPFGLGPAQGAVLALVMLAASYARGYSGFGFSALFVSAAALVMDPLDAAPVALIADFAMGVQLLTALRADVDWRRVGALLAGAFIGVPLGVLGLKAVSPDLARGLLAGFVLAMCALLLKGWRLTRPPGDGAHAATGVVSGLANSFAVGGLPVAAFFAAQDMAAARFRATLIAYFFLLDIWSLVWMGGAERITSETLRACLLAAPLIAAGLWLGSRRFSLATPQDFRRFSIVLLAGLSLAGFVKAIA